MSDLVKRLQDEAEQLEAGVRRNPGPLLAEAAEALARIEGYVQDALNERDDLRKAIDKAIENLQGCPCLYTTPCDPNCTCLTPYYSNGCTRCCRYGSPAQRRAYAERLAPVIDAAVHFSDEARWEPGSGLDLHLNGTARS